MKPLLAATCLIIVLGCGSQDLATAVSTGIRTYGIQVGAEFALDTTRTLDVGGNVVTAPLAMQDMFGQAVRQAGLRHGDAEVAIGCAEHVASLSIPDTTAWKAAPRGCETLTNPVAVVRTNSAWSGVYVTGQAWDREQGYRFTVRVPRWFGDPTMESSRIVPNSM